MCASSHPVSQQSLLDQTCSLTCQLSSWFLSELEENLMEFAPEETEVGEEGKGEEIESELVTLMKEEQEKAKEEEERKEKRRQDEEMIRQILAEFLT